MKKLLLASSLACFSIDSLAFNCAYQCRLQAEIRQNKADFYAASALLPPVLLSDIVNIELAELYSKRRDAFLHSAEILEAASKYVEQEKFGGGIDLNVKKKLFTFLEQVVGDKKTLIQLLDEVNHVEKYCFPKKDVHAMLLKIQMERFSLKEASQDFSNEKLEDLVELY